MPVKLEQIKRTLFGVRAFMVLVDFKELMLFSSIWFSNGDPLSFLELLKESVHE